MGWFSRRRQPEAPSTLESPPFPRLRWEHGGWLGRATLPIFAGFQARLGAYSGLSSDQQSEGTVYLSVQPGGHVKKAPPSSEQAAAYQYLLDHGETVRNSMLAAVLANYQEWRRDAAGDPIDPGLPEVHQPEDLRSLIGVGTVHVLATARDGIAYVGFEFGCDWDEEHGFGVLTHRHRIIEVAEAETAWAEHLALVDARQ